MKQNGYNDGHWLRTEALPAVFDREHREKVAMNVVRAICAITATIGLDSLVERGFPLGGRSAGVLAHAIEEKQAPIACEAACATHPRRRCC